MGWSAIIAAILQAVGPLLAEWLKKWLDSLLNRAAAELDEEPEPHLLLSKAFELTPRRAFARRALLRTMMRNASALATGTLSDGAAEDVRTVGLAANED